MVKMDRKWIGNGNFYRVEGIETGYRYGLETVEKWIEIGENVEKCEKTLLAQIFKTNQISKSNLSESKFNPNK